MSQILSPYTGRAAQQEVEFVKWEQIKNFLRFEQLMKAMGLSIFCETCTKVFGPGNDGILMTVHESGREATIQCNHKLRKFKTAKPEEIKVLLG